MADGLDKAINPQFTMEQMDAKAVQFKAETGFDGDIRYDLRNGVFKGIEGTMQSCTVQDTSSARLCAESILNELIPYLKTNRAQLTITRNYQNQYGCVIQLDQRINNISLEPISYMSFHFNTEGSYCFNLGSSIVPNLDVQTDKLISQSDAEDIFSREIDNKDIERTNAKLVITRYWSETTQENSQPDSYKPCWVMNYIYNSEHFGMYIDAITGKVLRIRQYYPMN
jgi:hypothetical protein